MTQIFNTHSLLMSNLAPQTVVKIVIYSKGCRFNFHVPWSEFSLPLCQPNYSTTRERSDSQVNISVPLTEYYILKPLQQPTLIVAINMALGHS